MDVYAAAVNDAVGVSIRHIVFTLLCWHHAECGSHSGSQRIVHSQPIGLY